MDECKPPALAHGSPYVGPDAPADEQPMTGTVIHAGRFTVLFCGACTGTQWMELQPILASYILV